MATYLHVKNWEQFQHYKDRNPPWIKLHRALLDDYEFSALPDSAKGQLILIWLFASQNEGKIPQDAKFLERKLGLSSECDLDVLVCAGFLIPEQVDSGPLASCKRTDSSLQAPCKPSRARERTKATYTATETDTSFAKFWDRHPRKVARKDAERAWSKIPTDEIPAVMAGFERALASKQWERDGGQFIPHPATWLNGRRWEDEYEPAQAVLPDSGGGFDGLAVASRRKFAGAA